ncbi:MAG: hypothetical protein Q8L39_06690 [Burkholderiales bacterium]|nr:hypothetical protein [Burkholderiales bacterium]
MHQYHLTQHITLAIKRCHQPLKWFAGKTNRLALYSLCLLGLEFNFYVARDWRYSALDSLEE